MGVTLLDKATAVAAVRPPSRIGDDQMLELSVAYLEGRIAPNQAAAALGVSRQCAWQRMMTAVARAVRQGRLRLYAGAGHEVVMVPPTHTNGRRESQR